MKLQNLILIFLAIALPVIMILSVYVSLQVDTAVLRAKYDSGLINAAHEAIVAFQLNTKNNKVSDVADTKIRGIEASFNVFQQSMATALGNTNASKRHIMSYVPALVLGLYDGYYVYTPKNKNDLTHELKPYVYYTRQYKNATDTRIVTINFSLDNYVAVYCYDGNSSYESRAGYLDIKPDNYNDLDATAKKYYDDAEDFTNWYNDTIRGLQYNGENKENTLKIVKSVRWAFREYPTSRRSIKF